MADPFRGSAFLFSSCDQLLPPSGNGVDIPAKIRAVSIAGGEAGGAKK